MMFKFGKKKDSQVPPKWMENVIQPLYQREQEMGIVIKKDSWPYVTMMADENGNPSYIPPNYMMGTSMVLCVEGFDLSSETDQQAYKKLGELVSQVSHFYFQVGLFTFLLGTEFDCATIHRQVSEIIGIQSFSYTAVNLSDGRGIGWNAIDGVMCEIEPLSLVREEE